MVEICNDNSLNFSDKIPVYASLFFLNPDGATCLAVLYYLHYVFYYKLTTPLFFSRKERASQAPAVSSCCNCLRLQEPLHPLEILHKLQRSSCFQPLKRAFKKFKAGKEPLT